MRRNPVILAAVFIHLLLWSGYVFAAVCPQTLETLANWYETDPPFSGVSQINLVAVLTNNSGGNLEFSGVSSDTFQLWSVPGLITTMPVTINAAPSGIVPSGNNFMYDLTIDLSSLPPTEDRLAFRPVSITLGTMEPNVVPLFSASISCTYSVSVPTLNEWGLLIFIIGAGSFAVYFLRMKGKASETCH